MFRILLASALSWSKSSWHMYMYFKCHLQHFDTYWLNLCHIISNLWGHVGFVMLNDFLHQEQVTSLLFTRFFWPSFFAVCWIHRCFWFHACYPMVCFLWVGSPGASLLRMANDNKRQGISQFTKNMPHNAPALHVCCRVRTQLQAHIDQLLMSMYFPFLFPIIFLNFILSFFFFYQSIFSDFWWFVGAKFA